MNFVSEPTRCLMKLTYFLLDIFNTCTCRFSFIFPDYFLQICPIFIYKVQNLESYPFFGGGGSAEFAAHVNSHRTASIINVCKVTVNKSPLRNAFNFFCTNQQFQTSSSVCVVEVLPKVTFGKFLKYSHAKEKSHWLYNVIILSVALAKSRIQAFSFLLDFWETILILVIYC